jgi:SAM-dependent methyltransferase
MAAPEAEFDRPKAKAFTMLMVRHLEGAAVSIMIEVGRRVGLFEAMATMGAVTSAEIAEKTGLSERYIREWLAAMVCGGIVEYAAGERTYRLPREHAAGLTGSSTRNLTTMAEMFPLMNRVIPNVVAAFRTGEGVPYSAYQPDFTGLMDRRSRPRFDELLFSTYLAKPEGLIPRLEAGIRVADVGCGTGYCIALMARRFPKSTFVGYDLSEEGIAEARATARGLDNASFVVQDIARFESPAPFHLITAFDAIHDQADPAGVMRRIRAALGSDGTFLMLDVWASSELADNVGVPMAPYLYTMSTMHCMSVSLAGGGPGLGTAWGHQVATRMLHDAGFKDVQLFERVDPANSLYVARG